MQLIQDESFQNYSFKDLRMLVDAVFVRGQEVSERDKIQAESILR